MKKYFMTAIFATTFMWAHGQDWQRPLAQQMGMGFASSAPLAQATGAVANPAGLSGLSEPTALMGTGISHGILSLQAHTALFAGNGWGVAVAHWGTPFFSRQTAGVSAGGNLGHVAWGARLMAYQWTAEELPSRRRLGLDVGAVVPLSENIRLGAYISQVSWGKAQPWALYQLPLMWQAGLEGKAHEKLSWAISLKQESLGSMAWQAGAIYRYKANLHCLMGVSSQPYQLYAGAQYALGQLQIGYGASRHATLGISQSLTVGYVFRKKKAKL